MIFDDTNFLYLRRIKYEKFISIDIFSNRDTFKKVKTNILIIDLIDFIYILEYKKCSIKHHESIVISLFTIINGVKPNEVMSMSVLPTCSHLEMLNIGKELHSYALRNIDLNENYFVGSALVDMYSNCKHVEKG